MLYKRSLLLQAGILLVGGGNSVVVDQKNEKDRRVEFHHRKMPD
jgi:hypothetical protein